ncbi:MAG TPA: hypothetical protein VL598_03080 [Trinickia sp.]|uniref:hypothetical protein n=1 Tax=Trinickia sp. TaxID=2571163 RepID=UPI002C746887|nr:hypothetical protein [Trinickia sp.]HTI16630.1 hypothetical protein [Trinickia sp.]
MAGEYAYADDFKPQLAPLPEKALSKTELSQALWSFGTALRTQIDGSLVLVNKALVVDVGEDFAKLAVPAYRRLEPLSVRQIPAAPICGDMRRISGLPEPRYVEVLKPLGIISRPTVVSCRGSG